MPFQKGQSGNPKGLPKGAHHEGRPADKLRLLCRQLVDKYELVKRLGLIAAGKPIDQAFMKDAGEVLPIPCDPKVQVRATEILLERGYGKVVQEVDLGENAGKFIVICETNANKS